MSLMLCTTKWFFFSFAVQLLSPGRGGWSQRQGWQLAAHSFFICTRHLCCPWVVQDRIAAGRDGSNCATYRPSRTTQRDSREHPGISWHREVRSTTTMSFQLIWITRGLDLWDNIKQQLQFVSCAIFWSGPRSCVFTPSNFTSRPNRGNSRRSCSCWVCQSHLCWL